MEQDSTIAKGNGVPVTKLRIGKKTNLIKTKIKTTEKIHPLNESSFQSRNQNLFHNSFIFIGEKR
jgi:hypothetical protein